MTAEVAILNKHGVAMAADSAVTTGDQKVYTTVDKLFSLCHKKPVGIMVYNNASVMGVPVETVIKEFRKGNPDLEPPHLEDYANAFEAFLVNDTSIFDDQARFLDINGAIWSVAGAFRRRFQASLPEDAKNVWGRPTLAEAKAAATAALDRLGLQINQAADLPIPDADRRRLVNGAATIINHHADQIYKALPITRIQERKLRSILGISLGKDIDFGVYTGFAIAGFGSDDVFPRLSSFEFGYSIDGITKIRMRKSHKVTHMGGTAVYPFAQIEVMRTFVEGRHALYKQVSREFLASFFAEQSAILQADPAKAALVPDLIAIGVKLSADLEGALQALAQEGFVDPLVTVIQSMPKERLAVLAESLINLTALKSSTEDETVGGPIDVAVISKGDGFVWVKRKSYFDAANNPHIIQ